MDRSFRGTPLYRHELAESARYYFWAEQYPEEDPFANELEDYTGEWLITAIDPEHLESFIDFAALGGPFPDSPLEWD